MLFKLSNLNSNVAPTLGYLNPALNNSAQGITAAPREISEFTQQDGRKKKTAERSCVTNVTRLFRTCFVVIFT